jgi:serine/threonine protein kinase/tetratricopeptide (TPR) repeat protein
VREGRRLGPYEILAPLGAGGMGEVYRARDTRLGRDVAVKVLPESVARDPVRVSRFEREARALAALSHPDILSVFDTGRQDDVTYVVTELLEGETLRERISRERLPWRRAVEVAAAIADGLSAAHGKGVVHRDLKPENVFVATDGRVKVLDFGLARLGVAGADVEREEPTETSPGTAAGTVLGTVGYMSPEQVRGQATDARSDLFALGLVLFEMLTGRRAFARETAAETMTAILREPAPEVSLSGSDAPPELGRTVAHCLEKASGERFQSASDLAFALRSTLGAPAGGPRVIGVGDAPSRRQRPSIAVLPFANLSPDPDQEWFCDGLTEEIITALSKIRGLRVISRNSAMTLKGARKTTREIGGLLDVGHVLEGSVRRAGQSLRITAQLIDVTTDGHLWAERYGGTLDDVFDIQEKVARAIAEALRVRLNPEEDRRVGERLLTDVRAYECQHRARHDLHLCTRSGLESALRRLRQGLDIVGEHPVLHAAVAQAHLWAMEADLEPRGAALEAARRATEKARGLGVRHAQAVLAWLERVDGDHRRAIRHFENVLEEDRANVDALLWLSSSYAYQAGRPAEGRAVAGRLIAIDPLTVISRFPLGWACATEGDWSGAQAVFEEMGRSDPAVRFVKFHLMMPLARLGRTADACALADETVAEDASDMFAEAAMLFKSALRGDRECLVAGVEGARREYYWHDPEFPQWIAGWLALVGENDRALVWLERWVDRGAINHPLLARHDTFLQGLRGEARFQRLLDRVEPEWERFVPRFRTED